jgi:hypothetical protein
VLTRDDDTVTSGPEPVASRPRMFGGVAEPVLLPWSWALDRLSNARNYWIATTRADGRPHSRPVWGVVVDEAVFFSTGSLAVANLVHSPEISLHSESATELVILEGVATVEVDQSVIVRVCDDYSVKYDEAMDPDHLPGPFYRTRPRVAFGWLASASFTDGGAVFHGTATKWTFAGDV